MGFQTTLVFDNDNLDILLDDPNIGKAIHAAILNINGPYFNNESLIIGLSDVGPVRLGVAIESHDSDRSVTLKLTDLSAILLTESG